MTASSSSCLQQRLRKILNQCVQHSNTVSNQITQRYAVFVCDDATILPGEWNLGQMFKQFFGENKNEKWFEYNVFDNHFPSHRELLSLNVITITGSGCDAFDNKTKWIINLRQLIRDIVYKPEYFHIKLIGLCFGHQIIAQSLNGMVDVNPKKKGIHDHWEIGVKDMKLTKHFYKTFPYFYKKYGDRKMLKVNMHHRDAVTKIPDNGKLMAYSKYTDHEMYVIGDRIIGFQGHPECPLQFIRDVIDYEYKGEHISKNTYEFGKQRLYISNDHDIWRELLREWMRR
eukprot:271555_1